MLDEEDGVRRRDGGPQQFPGVTDCGRCHDLEARDAEEQLLEALTVGGAVSPSSTHRRAHHERDLHASARDPAELCRVVDQLVHDEGAEISEHHLDDRVKATQGQTTRDTDEPRFRDRSRDDPVGKLGRQSASDLERTPVGVKDVLAEDEDERVLLKSSV